MRKTALLFALVVPTFFAAPVQAQNYYPWCAVYGGGRTGGGTNCGFVSYRQCMATVSGIGGFCQRNPFFYDRPRPSRRMRDYDQ